MNKMYFLTSWEKDKTKTWSGTVWGLYVALSSLYEIQVIDIPKPKISFLGKLKMLLRLVLHQNYWDAGIDYLKTKKKFVRKALSGQKKQIVFQFEEYAEVMPHRDIYIYQDMSLDAVYDMYYNNPSAFFSSNYSTFNISCIQNRRKKQNEYYKKANAVFVMGEWLQRYLTSSLKLNNVYAVGGGVNIDVDKIDHRFKLGNKILFIGRDFKRKGGEITVEAFKHAKEQRPELELHVAGPPVDPYKGKNIPGYYYHGDCNRDNLANLYNKCDIFCMPSYFEAYGLVFIEALTYGLPCIGRNCFEMPFFIENKVTGLLIDDDDIDVYASYMLNLLDNKEIHKTVKQRQYMYIEQYSWENVANQIKDIIEERSCIQDL